MTKDGIEQGIRSIAFPSISTGVYGFDLVEWVLFDPETESVYEREVDKLYARK